jgi:type II secretory pathway predicted ATPase ExeA
MIPYFNTAGPCVEGEHYMVSPARRVGRVRRLIDEGKYFTIHAGRQTGKTTNARWLVKELNGGDTYCATWVDIQAAREQPDPAAAFKTICTKLDMALALDLPALDRPDAGLLLADPATAILRYLIAVSAVAPRPLVVFFDEVDGLTGQAMVSFLTQLRDGYIGRSTTPFPHSLALIGMRQVRDYVINTEERRAVAWLGTTSPFNITAEAATLEPFTRDDVAELLGQHTAHTEQRFEDEAVAEVFRLSQGHPWFVNALADQVVNRDVEDRSAAVTAAHIEAAKETIILERRTHIDSLVARLREPRVRKIIEPMLVGSRTAEDVLDDDFAYVRGLGLIVQRDRRYQVANPIYREVIPRALTHIQEMQIPQETSWYVRDDGSLDVPKLMAAWQKFWRQDGHLAAAGFLYREAGPHLMLMAFLQRVVNGGGRVEREYGLGRGALDLMLFWRAERHAVEVKLRRDTETEAEALEQVLRYLDAAGLDEGWLLLFDLRQGLTWEDKLFTRDEQTADKLVHVVGC